MKKIGVATLLFVVAILTLLLCFFFNRGYREKVILLDGVSFGMSPEEAKRNLGQMLDERSETHLVSSSTDYFQAYNINMFKHEATMELKYICQRNKYVLQGINVSFSAVDEPEKLFDEIKNELLSQFQGIEERSKLVEKVVTKDRENYFELYLSHGPVGTAYLLKAKESEIILEIYCTEFYR